MWRFRDGNGFRTPSSPLSTSLVNRAGVGDIGAMLHVNDLTYRLGERVLIDKASFAVPDGARVGIVGRNGAGKTTLFRILMGEIASESGSIGLPKGVRIGAVSQEAPGGPESLIDVVLAADTERARLIAEAEHADGMRRAEIEMRLTDIGAHAAPARAAAILHGLGFDAAAQARPCSDFSGGWRMRVALAAVLFTEPDLLLLDEPTNYLDLEGTMWLYDYLGRYPHTALVISHDRELLDEAVDHILHLDQAKLTLYRGGYTSFARQRAEQLMLQVKAKAKQEAEAKHLQAFVDRFRAKATKARQAQSRLKRLEKMTPIAGIVEETTLPFDLPSPEKPLSPPLVRVDKANAGYGDRVVLQRLDLTILPDDRIALLGANGNGKSTFCKVVGRRLDPLSGEVVASSKLEVAYFAQHQLDELRLADTPYGPRRRAHEGRARGADPRALRPVRLLRPEGRHAGLEALGRREGAPAARARGLRRPRICSSSTSRRNHLDIDSRPGAGGGDQRLRRGGDHRQPRPLP